MRVLLLGGTGEARALANALHPRVDIVSSLAGRVPDPALPVGPVRIGGFDHSEPSPEVSWHKTIAALDALLRAWPTDS